MPLVIPPGFAQVAYNITHDSVARPTMVTMGFTLGSADTVAEVQVLTEGWYDGFRDTLAATFDTETNILSATARYVLPSGGDPFTAISTLAATPGTRNADSEPGNVAVLVHKRSNQGGRRGRGRLYFPWFISDTNTGEAGNIAAGTVTALQTAMDNWFATFNDVDGAVVPVILHDSTRRTITHPSSTVTTITESEVAVPVPAVISSLVVDPRIATQRRRLR